MINRRELLFNMVTLTIKSNVTGAITIDGQSFSQVKEASVRLPQNKEVEWRVEADGYISKSGTVIMDGEKVIEVSLDLEIAQFTINTNVPSTITINGDISTGVTTKSITVIPGDTVTWSVAADEYNTQSGSEAVSRNTTKDISLVFNGVTSKCKSGYIWCTDGSFVAPASYQSSGKTAYGYALSNTKVARLTKTTETYQWVNHKYGNLVNNYYNSTGINSMDDGVSNSEKLRNMYPILFKSDHSPGIYYACTQVNAGKTSYMPAVMELSELFDSVYSGYSGDMKANLTLAGLYESCNYRDKRGTNALGDVMSSTEDSNDTTRIYSYYTGGMGEGGTWNWTMPKTYGLFIIPFFDFSS